jgi:iron complex transport system substrate-binding protein
VTACLAAAFAVSGAGAEAAHAAVTAQSATDGTRTLTVSQVVGLDAAGQQVQADGAGYDATKGVYVAFCVLRPAGAAPEPCGGVGASSAAWVSSSPPGYAGDLATSYGPGGTFSVPVTVSATIGEYDCRTVQCGVVTRNDHTRSGDRSQDVLVPVGFAGAPGDLPLATGTSTAADAVTSTVRIRPVAVSPKPKLPVTVTSADGTKATITSADRIVSLNGSISEIVYALGLGDRVVGRDVSTTFTEAADVPLVTRAHDVSAESVLSRRPTIVLANQDSGPKDALAQIRAAGVPVLVFDDPTTIDGIGAREVAVARALGVRPLGALLRARTADELDAARDDVPTKGRKPVVAFLYLRGQAGVYLIGGKGSGADEMIRAAGGVDAGTKLGLDDEFTPITSEALVAAKPDVILVTTTGLQSVGGVDGLVKIPGIAQTPAGANRRVVAEEDGLLFSFGTRTPAALEQLVQKLHGTGESSP